MIPLETADGKLYNMDIMKKDQIGISSDNVSGLRMATTHSSLSSLTTL
mgnify:CR=1 FL=1